MARKNTNSRNSRNQRRKSYENKLKHRNSNKRDYLDRPIKDGAKTDRKHTRQALRNDW